MTYSPLGVYAQVGLETGVLSASPHKLILMLYDGVISAAAVAKGEMEQGNIPARGGAISKAIALIGELEASLNHEAGGEIAANLAALYDYMTRRLVAANIENRVEGIDEVVRLLSDLREAWSSIRGKHET